MVTQDLEPNPFFKNKENHGNIFMLDQAKSSKRTTVKVVCAMFHLLMYLSAHPWVTFTLVVVNNAAIKVAMLT